MKRFWKVVWIAFSLPIIFAVLDVAGAKMWEQIGGWGGDAYVTAETAYQGLFWSFAYILIIAISLTYYLMRKDRSEAAALFFIPALLLQFGVEDIFFYIFRGLDLYHDTLPWLYGNLYPVTFLADVFNGGIISGGILMASVVLGIFLAYRAAIVLERIPG